jgi:hypothetical protein
MTTTIHTRNFDGEGYDLVTGRDVAGGQFIGTLFWDGWIGDAPGWVLRFGQEGLNEEDFLPDTTSEIEAMLAERGYELDTTSRVEIERFDEEMRQ